MRKELREQLERLTPAQREEVLRQLRERSKRDRAPEPSALVSKAEYDREAPLSAEQRRLWFLQALSPASAAYHVPLAVKLNGELDVDRMREALRLLVARHEILRTVFTEREEGPIQVILEPTVDVELLFEDVCGDLDPDASVREHLAREVRQPFDLATQIPLRVALVRVADDEHVLLMLFHHIAIDEWTTGIVFLELAELYASLQEEREPVLEAETLQYADYALWQRQKTESPAFSQGKEFWREYLRGAPEDVQWPMGKESRNEHRPEHVIEFELDADLTRLIRAMASERDTTVFVAMYALFSAFLVRHTGQRDLTIGLPVTMREAIELQGLVGCLLNTIPTRANVPLDQGFDAWLAQFHEDWLRSLPHHWVPFDEIVQAVGAKRQPGKLPLFDVMFSVVPGQNAGGNIAGLEASHFEWTGPREAKSAMGLSLVDHDDHIDAVLEYDATRFTRAQMQRLATGLQRFTRSCVEEPHRLLAEQPLVADDEARELFEWSRGPVAYASREPVHRLVELAVERHPERVALTGEHGEWTYGQLNDYANRLAATLIERGVSRGATVGVSLERSPRLIAALLGVLKAGAAYVPLEPGLPKARLDFMALDSGIGTIICDEAGRRATDWGSLEILDVAGALVGEEPAANRELQIDPEQLAYVLYTSGSTGRPKGVMVPHRAVVNHVHAKTACCEYSSEDVFLFRSSYGFDASVSEIFVPLANGARVVVARPGGHRDFRYLANLIDREAVTVMETVPSGLEMMLEEPAFVSCRSLKKVILGGEALTSSVRDAFIEQTGADLYNPYGPTEACVETTMHLCRHADQPVRIGAPMPNYQAHVLDPVLAPSPVEVSGELYISGRGLAHGYASLPRQTATAFLPDPFSDVAGATMYRSGDLVRWQQGGELSFVGRRDHQIQVRGIRVELEELEAWLAQMPRIRSAAVQPVGEREGRADGLVGYVVPEAGYEPDPAELRQHLAEHVAEAVIPGQFVVLEELPMLSSGKIDRRSLPDPGEQLLRARTRVAPRTDTERTIAEVWCRHLELEEVGVHEDFFELGGHSLMAVRVVHDLVEALGHDLSLGTLFDASTIAELAQQADSEPRGELIPIRHREYGDEAPLSADQRSLWILQKLDPGSIAYHVPLAVRLVGILDTDALRGAVTDLVRRHEVLRTVFPERPSGPVQVILDAPEAFDWTFEDLRDRESPEMEGEALFARVVETPFDLEEETAFRVVLCRVGEDRYALLLLFHHLVIDEWTTGLVVHELREFYQARLHDREPELHELPVQYADYAIWQGELRQTETFEQGLSFWREHLDGARATVQWPFGDDHARDGHGAGIVEWRRDADALTQLAKAQGTTVFGVLYALFSGFLAQYTGQRDLTIGLPSTLRQRPELRGLVGLLLNTLPARARVGLERSFEQWLEESWRAWNTTAEHRWIPLEDIVGAVAAERRVGTLPLFEVMFTFVPDDGPLERFGDLSVEPIPSAGRREAKASLSVLVTEREGSLVGTFTYDESRFDHRSIQQMVEHFQHFVDRCLRSPSQPMVEHPLLRLDEIRDARRRGQGTSNLEREVPVHEAFARCAREFPDRPALIFDGGEWSYGELQKRVDRVASHLHHRGVGAETAVGVSVERSPELVAVLLGVLQAGAGYVPLDPSLPVARLRYITEDAGVRVVVCDEKGAAAIGDSSDSILVADILSEEFEEGQAPITPVDGKNLAYILYTSGSTGQPKGVEVPHTGMADHVRWLAGAFEVDSDEIFLLKSPVGFDVSVSEIFVPLTRGARLVIPSHGVEYDPGALIDVLREYSVGTVRMVPTTLDLLVDHLERNGGTLPVRRIAVGGEALSADLVHRLGKVYSGELYNLYGLTETSVSVTWEHVSAEPPFSTVPIGAPVDNHRVYVLGSGLRFAPTEQRGQLYVGGKGLARGYRGQPRRTAEFFIPDELASSAGSRMYRTGDVTAWTADGRIIYCGRHDGQVQLRGLRVELGEIESVLAGASGVRQAAVRALDVSQGRAESLVGYVVMEDGAEFDVATLRAHLQTHLSEALVPGWFISLPKMPRTSSGKIDRKSLPAPERESRGGDLVAPRNDIEQLLAQVWKQELGLGEVGIHENFFAIGGDSLKGIQIASRLREQGVSFNAADFVQFQTIAELAAAATLHDAELEEEDLNGEVLLTPIQLRFWEKDYPFPEQKWQLQIGAAPDWIDPEHLRQATSKLERHHDSLRLRFALSEGDWVQSYSEEPGDNHVVVATIDEESAEEVLRETIDTMAAALDLGDGPLFRVGLVRDEQGERGYLLLMVHFLVADGFSLRILHEDLLRACRELSSSEEVSLPRKTSSFKRWSTRLSEIANHPDILAEREYWTREELRSARFRIPTTRPAAEGTNTEASTTRSVFRLSEDETRRLLSSAREAYGMTDAEVALTALGRAVTEYAQAERVAVTLRGHGRDAEVVGRLSVDRTVGWFVALYPVVVEVVSEEWPRRALVTVKEQMRAVPNGGLGYGILRYLTPDKDVRAELAAMGEPDIIFNYFGTADGAESPGDLETSHDLLPERFRCNQRSAVLEVYGAVLNGRLSFEFSYSSALHDESVIDALKASFEASFEQIADHCDSESSAGGQFTPSDFDLVNADEAMLDKIASLFGDD